MRLSIVAAAAVLARPLLAAAAPRPAGAAAATTAPCPGLTGLELPHTTPQCGPGRSAGVRRWPPTGAVGR